MTLRVEKKEDRHFIRNFLMEALPRTSEFDEHWFPVYEFHEDGLNNQNYFNVTNLSVFDFWMNCEKITEHSKFYYLPVAYEIIDGCNMFIARYAKCLWLRLDFGQEKDYASAEDAYVSFRQAYSCARELGRLEMPSHIIESEGCIVVYWFLKKTLSIDFFHDSKKIELDRKPWRVEINASPFVAAMHEIYEALKEQGLQVLDTECVREFSQMLPLPFGRRLPVRY